jgi:hypothetical protein
MRGGRNALRRDDAQRRQAYGFGAEAADALINIQLADGSMPRCRRREKLYAARFKHKLPYKATDATAQAIRLFALLYAATRDLKYHEAALNAEEYLFSVQIPREAESVSQARFITKKRNRGRSARQKRPVCVGYSIRSFGDAMDGRYRRGGYDADTFLKELF